MSVYLSSSTIESYVGNVLPLWLVSDIDLSKANINWSVKGAAVLLRDFKKEKTFSFSHGVILTLLREGTSTVSCEYDGEIFECTVIISKRRNEEDFSKLLPFKADFHIHSSLEHKPDLFAIRTTELIGDLVKSCHKSKAIDCSVITDHAIVTNNRDFYEGFTKNEEIDHDGLVIFPGSESEVTFIENDRFGLPHKNSGELVTLNASRYSHSYDWDTYYKAMSECPFAIVALAHPLVVGWDMNGIWNFKLYKNSRNEIFRRIVRMVEVGHHTDGGTGFLFHYTYSQALDCALKVSPTCDTDSHGEYVPDLSKTIILASEKSKEMFHEAIVNNRLYACQSGCVNLKFTVNGCIMGQTAEMCDSYEFFVKASLMENVENAEPVLLNVISDYGNKLLSIPFDKEAKFEIKSDTARYFYVELVDSMGRKTISSAVWTGRSFDDYSFMDKLLPLDKSDFSVIHEQSNSDASVLVNGNPREVWSTPEKSASFVIDMKEQKTFCAVGHYTPTLYRFEIREGEFTSQTAATFVSRYRISVSNDNQSFTEVKTGYIREFGGEELLCFDRVSARYIRFEALSNTGDESYIDFLYGQGIRIAELSVFN